MPALDVSLCSDALLLIGGGTIESFSDGTDKSLVAGALYPGVRDALMASYPWRFTLKKAQLARDTAAPVNEWTYGYAMPADLLALRAIFASAAIGAEPLREFEIFENRILADVPAAWADYQARVEEARFPAYFAQALRYHLAANFAMTVTDKPSIAQLWAGQAELATSQGRRTDAQQQPGQVLDDFTLIKARFA